MSLNISPNFSSSRSRLRLSSLLPPTLYHHSVKTLLLLCYYPGSSTTTVMAAKLVGLDSLHRLNPQNHLSSSRRHDSSQVAGITSRYLFSSLKPFAPKSPFSHLLIEGFDVEQIWQQFDLQSQPLLLSLHRNIKHLDEEEYNKMKKMATRCKMQVSVWYLFLWTGEVSGQLERTGKRIFIWNTDAWGYGTGTTSLYQSHPWVLAVLPDGDALGVLEDTTRCCDAVRLT